MKPKKVWIILAIVFLIIALLFGIGGVIGEISPPDPSGFTDEVIYNKGTIKEIKINNNKDISMSHIILLEESKDGLAIYREALINPKNTNLDLKVGDQIVFGLSPTDQNLYTDEKKSSIDVIYLSNNDNIIVSLDSYQNYIRYNMNISNKFAWLGLIIFLPLSAIFYFQWFHKRKKR